MKTLNFSRDFQVALIVAAIGGASTATLADIKVQGETGTVITAQK